MGRGNYASKKMDAGSATDAATAYKHALKLCGEGAYGKALTVSVHHAREYSLVNIRIRRKQNYKTRLVNRLLRITSAVLQQSKGNTTRCRLLSGMSAIGCSQDNGEVRDTFGIETIDWLFGIWLWVSSIESFSSTARKIHSVESRVRITAVRSR